MNSKTRNAEAPWDVFDASSYSAHNYATVREDDAEILELMASFYEGLPDDREVIDVGTGANLYPLLAAVPRARSIVAWEFSATNIHWLRSAVAGQIAPNWHAFWDRLRDTAPGLYGEAGWDALAPKLQIRHASVFDLPERAYDVGSMHFVAESLSDEGAEFEAACTAFVTCVRPGGAVIASFMENSEGYDVGGVRFPAYPITAEDLERAFEGQVEELQIHRIEIPGSPVRPGYTGMLVLTATVI